jgi:hypothetical protein
MKHRSNRNNSKGRRKNNLNEQGAKMMAEIIPKEIRK